LELKQSVDGKIDRFFKRLKNYVDVNIYIGKQNFIAYPIGSVYSASVLILGALLQVLALLLITHILSDGVNTSNPIPTFSATALFDSFSLSFMEGAILTTGIFLVAALCTYSGETLVLKLAVELEINLIKNIFNYLGTISGGIQIIEKKYTLLYLSKILSNSTRLAGRVLRLQFAIIQPFLKAIVLMIVLLLMDWDITLIILGVLLLFGLLHYKINLRAVKYSKQFEESNITARRILNLKLQSALVSLGVKSMEINDFSQERDVILNKESYRMRRQVTEESRLASDFAKAIIILFLLATMTEFGKLQSQHVLTSLLSYSFVLLVFLLSLQSTLVCLTNISRFHPQTSRYVNLINSSDNKKSTLSKTDLYLPIISDTGKVRKVFLNNSSTLLIVSPAEKVVNTHIGILSSIKKNKKSKNHTNNYQLIAKDKSIKNQEMLLPYTITTSIQDTINLINKNDINGLQINYISPADAKILAPNLQTLYVYSPEDSRLKPWLGKPIQNEQITEQDENDDFDDG